MAYTNCGDQDVTGSSTMISEAHWHLLTTRILWVVKIYLCRFPSMSFYSHLHPPVLLDHFLRISLLSGFLSLMKDFNNWYLIILQFFFLFYFIYLFIYFLFYFWLCWVFIAARGLSLVAVSGGHSLLRCAGFSLRWLLLLWSTGSRVRGLQ